MTTSTVFEFANLTFADFQKTRRFCSDLPKALGIDAKEVSRTGFTYLGKPGVPGPLYIEILDEAWPDDIRAQGSFHMLIGAQTEIGFDLSRFERQLFEFAASEDYCSRAPLADDRFTITDAVVEDAVNALALIVQDRIGVTDGGVAGQYFSGDERDDVRALLQAYADCEKTYDDNEKAES